MKNVAWLLEPPKQNIADLYQRYEVKFVAENPRSLDRFRDDMEGFFEFMQDWAAQNFQPETDFFVLTGNLTLIVAAAFGIAKRYPERLLFLRYDHGLGRYCEESLIRTLTQQT